MSLKITQDRVAEVLKSIRSLTDQDAFVGVPAENAARQPEPGDPQPANNAVIGYINEFGSPAKNIPARPHLRPGVESVQAKIADVLKKGAADALDGKRKAAATALVKAGLIAETAVKEKITSGLTPALDPKTLAARRRAGAQGETPLLRTGQYRNSITSVVRPKARGVDAQH